MHLQSILSAFTKLKHSSCRDLDSYPASPSNDGERTSSQNSMARGGKPLYASIASIANFTRERVFPDSYSRFTNPSMTLVQMTISPLSIQSGWECLHQRLVSSHRKVRQTGHRSQHDQISSPRRRCFFALPPQEPQMEHPTERPMKSRMVMRMAF